MTQTQASLRGPTAPPPPPAQERVRVRNVKALLYRICYLIPACSIHSALPIWTNREQHRANANNSSSPLNMDAAPTTSAGRPCTTKEKQ